MVESCPLIWEWYGIEKIDVEAVKEIVSRKILDFGFCCAERVFDPVPCVAYGASEMMKVWLDRGLLDCSVIVCEGAGTVITSNGSLVQGIGARLTGIVKTSPIPRIIEKIEKQVGSS